MTIKCISSRQCWIISLSEIKKWTHCPPFPWKVDLQSNIKHIHRESSCTSVPSSQDGGHSSWEWEKQSEVELHAVSAKRDQDARNTTACSRTLPFHRRAPLCGWKVFCMIFAATHRCRRWKDDIACQLWKHGYILSKHRLLPDTS